MSIQAAGQTLPRPRLVRRARNAAVFQRAIDAGLPPVAARVLAARAVPAGADVREFLAPRLKQLDPPSLLADMQTGSERLAAAVVDAEVIGIQTDYDMDGLGAHATFRRTLGEVFGHPAGKLVSFVGHRLSDGYGLSAPLAQRIASNSPRPQVLVTADCGSADEDRIALLANAGIDVLVTDHHQIPEDGPPRSAYACINPQRRDCLYPDKAIAGGFVIWLLLCATRRLLIDAGHLPRDTPHLGSMLDYVACSTVADCVSLASVNNRAIIRHGLRLMNGASRPCWRRLQQALAAGPVDAATIAFGIAPRVNAVTRLSDPFAALNFLMADGGPEAGRWADVLERNNEERKQIERDMVAGVLDPAAERVEQRQIGVTLLLDEGHPGVQGICCSRIVEAYGRPALLFSPTLKDPDLIVGSARGVDGLDLRGALQHVATHHPNLICSFGGHKAAAGITIRRSDFDSFASAFETALAEQLTFDQLGPVRYSDGELAPNEFTLETLETLQVLEPTGRGFESPTFDGEFRVAQARPVGDGTHLKMQMETAHGGTAPAIWFRARRSKADDMPVRRGDVAHFVYQLMDNNGYGPRRIEINIRARVTPAA
ncbi:single-stranded-DNA-specific exonuclease RecJ [Candidatus Rariloculus sp.]|uniref:single-stranded-DNA-specific exonuclease RecJ n=1 Tax=Candidatus Rariloculus sp. TaxID=3101265 RepID=UPI003D11B2AF